MKFKEGAEPVSSSDYFYDLFLGGYINPSKFLEDEADIKKVDEAMETIMEFLDGLQDDGLLEEM